MIDLTNHIGIRRGSYKSKENRAQKLVDAWPTLLTMMERYINIGEGTSLRARCAYGVLLMMETGIRVGNETSAEGYVCNQKHHQDYGKVIQVYGLTTLTKEHVATRRNVLHLNFLGKKAVQQTLHTSNPTLVKYANIISLYHKQPTWLGITYGDIYDFVKRSIGRNYKPKDIRTAAVNILFLRNVNKHAALHRKYVNKSDVKKSIDTLVHATADTIGHTKGVCKSAYLSKRMLTTMQEHLIARLQRNTNTNTNRR